MLYEKMRKRNESVFLSRYTGASKKRMKSIENKGKGSRKKSMRVKSQNKSNFIKTVCKHMKLGKVYWMDAWKTYGT